MSRTMNFVGTVILNGIFVHFSIFFVIISGCPFGQNEHTYSRPQRVIEPSTCVSLLTFHRYFLFIYLACLMQRVLKKNLADAVPYAGHWCQSTK